MHRREMDSFGFLASQKALEVSPVTVLATDQPAHAAFPPHAHSSAQLIYAISGVMIVRVAAGNWVVPTGRAVWVPGGVRHEIQIASDVQIRTVYVAAEARDTLPDSCHVILVSALLRELIVTAAKLGPAAGHGERERRVLALILDEICVAEPLLLHVPMPCHPALRELCAELIVQPSLEATLQGWAERAGMNPRTFARAFQRETGMTHGVWCRHTRVLLSLPQLAGGASVLDVALEHGYDSPSAFTAMFRKVLGVAPSEYFK
ncbi:AraC-like DNA-binding protein/mannose-6-phosphate isomerase-like protein (cupin superfamily) [Paraburkholderia bryophila]|uniref:AraC-like DNA-binding protein/mannose-6-phosphate isomerase-like protein (Cupin superfamily) n=2 Tax=Paraburkholderia bryophila TaxID=420952 RepID=A0A7Y9W635_9BURK|nr:AraC-like DNA-binding protein/mannose-6-phosphate isomerase-like protein (cupin superfamily) [Paraburkholderia bryophila]